MTPILTPTTKEKLRMVAILAMDQTGAIGYNNDLIFHNKEDLEFFKKTTAGHPCIMGRKTFESLGKILPGRQTIIISSQGADLINQIVTDYKVPRGTPCPLVIDGTNIQKSIGGIMENLGATSAYICGGASIYELFLRHIECWIVTKYAVNVRKDGIKKKLLPKDWKEGLLTSIDVNWLGSNWVSMGHGVFKNIRYTVRNYNTKGILPAYDPLSLPME